MESATGPARTTATEAACPATQASQGFCAISASPDSQARHACPAPAPALRPAGVAAAAALALDNVSAPSDGLGSVARTACPAFGATHAQCARRLATLLAGPAAAVARTAATERASATRALQAQRAISAFRAAQARRACPAPHARRPAARATAAGPATDSAFARRAGRTLLWAASTAHPATLGRCALHALLVTPSEGPAAGAGRMAALEPARATLASVEQAAPVVQQATMARRARRVSPATLSAASVMAAATAVAAAAPAFATTASAARSARLVSSTSGDLRARPARRA